jgi:hypothetical protein
MATSKWTNGSSTGGAWDLSENATMRLPLGRSATVVRVERGTVLVTQQGELEDHVLEAGDEVILVGGGVAVAWAFTEAAISVGEATAIVSRRALPTRLRSRSLVPAALGVM